MRRRGRLCCGSEWNRRTFRLSLGENLDQAEITPLAVAFIVSILLCRDAHVFGDIDMYVVFEDGSRQYRVQEGDVVKLDYREADVGASLEFNRILLAHSDNATTIGQPVIDGARVVAEVVDHPSTKLYIQHFRRRKNYRRLKGHRQPYTSVRIRQIVVPN
jgi:large subunit ribosomal protein L21